MQEYVEFLKAHPMLSLAWVGLFIAVVVTLFKSGFSKVKTVDHQQAIFLMNKEDAKVIDVRANGDFRKGHIINAQNVPMADIKNNQIANLEKYKTTPIILVCNAGMTSSQAAQILVKQGFEKVFNLKGGMGDWQAANMPVSKSKR
ncbi:rhodanese-like domain-containing protein [Shewanella algae]|uniref:rhodanese-like domain-containing protein n=1 Tax=Shewanella algae TaxID=38313 RepID=UPI0005EC2830|nr:rhodanese-like domain-containing protein [Shewanella algae]MBO2559047.1 rhodanese-like domain-containing protein [Shewanella algae]MBO2588921.1 rhodanese-like domain-containing protein [Shewanella algae]MBO2643552.1 rhodanese-like domain-containing protein [Shewanella algae]MDV2963995.1 rhodanese-like domain-containing protein [Shewanella algae]OHY55580.1 rhodanese-like domain-containing protein [Shewanella algae]